MALPKLNAEHIEAINSAMHAAEGSVPKAAASLGWGWDANKLRQVINRNDGLREIWIKKEKPEQNVVTPLEVEMTSIHRPEIPMAEEVESLPDSMDEKLLIGSLEEHEVEYRKQLAAIGEDENTLEFMVASGKLQSQFALCTLNSLTGGLVKSYNELRLAQKETMDDLKSLLSAADPVEKALLVDREKVLRDFYIQLHEIQQGAYDRVAKAFYLQMEARKLDREKNKMGRPKKMLGITAMPGSRVAVSMGNDGNGANGHG